MDEMTDERKEPLKVAFVGQSTFFEPCSLAAEADGILGRFIDFRHDDDPSDMLAALHNWEPDVAVFFKPEVVPPAALAQLKCITVGYATEPLPMSGSAPNADLDRRWLTFSQLDPSNYDRMIAYSPLIVPAIKKIMPVWRVLPLPVDDRFFRDVVPLWNRPRIIFIGRSTPQRETFLSSIKHRFDIVHFAHGVSADELEKIADDFDVGINLHNDTYPNFENRASLHLAAGHLLLSEPLQPTFGLEPDIDFIQVRSPDDLYRSVHMAVEYPDTFRRVRVRGRDKAELFRASVVYARLVDALVRDIKVFGTDRTHAGATSR